MKNFYLAALILGSLALYHSQAPPTQHECIHDYLDYTPTIIEDETEEAALALQGNESLLSFHHHKHHVKGNDVIEEIDFDVPIKQFVEAKMKQSTYAPIRIFVDYSDLATAPTATAKSLQVDFIPNIVAFFEGAVSVIPRVTPITIPSSVLCPTFNPPASYETNGVSADLIIFVTWNNDDTVSYTAFGSVCMQSSTNNRPIVGQMNINLYYYDPTQYSYQFSVVQHEFTHILGFSQQMFQYYINPVTGATLPLNQVVQSVTSRGVPTTQIVLPNVVALAQAYFNCPTLTGLELENQGPQGTIGSHWETRLVADETMVASTNFVSYYSPFTAAVLVGTGWYQFNTSYTLGNQWGYQKGCGFTNSSCVVNNVSAYPEWCTNYNSTGCTYDAKMKATCQTYPGNPQYSFWNYYGAGTSVTSSDDFADNCPDYLPWSNGDCRNTANNAGYPFYQEVYGATSRCFNGNMTLKSFAKYKGLPTAACFNSHCYYNYNNNSYSLFVLVNGTAIYCPANGGNVSIPLTTYSGLITCPPAVQVCVYPACPQNCSGNGQCVDGACVCNSGYTGTNCGLARMRLIGRKSNAQPVLRYNLDRLLGKRERKEY